MKHTTDGKGVEKDVLKAYAWYRCAMENARRKKGSGKGGTEAALEQDATRSLGQLMSSINPGDLRNANALANEYIQRYATATP